MSNVSI